MKYKANYFIGADIDDIMKDPEEIKRAVTIAFYFEQNCGILLQAMVEVTAACAERGIELPAGVDWTNRTMRTFLSTLGHLLDGGAGYPKSDEQMLVDDDVEKVLDETESD